MLSGLMTGLNGLKKKTYVGKILIQIHSHLEKMPFSFYIIQFIPIQKIINLKAKNLKMHLLLQKKLKNQDIIITIMKIRKIIKKVIIH